MPDLNKEIKLSDLFRRRAKEPDETVEKPKEAKPPKERKALFSRGKGSDPKEKKAKEPKAPKEPRRSRKKDADVAPRSAPALPQIPLMRAFNLMPKEDARDKGTRVALPQIAVALLGVVVFGGLGAAYMVTSSGVSSKQAKLDDLRAQLAELEAEVQAPDEGAAAFGAAGEARTSALSAALATRVAWDRVLRQVSLVLPEDVWLATLTATTPFASADVSAATVGAAAGPAPNTLSLVGFGVDAESVAKVVSRLSAVPEFTSVQLQSITRDTTSDAGAYAFTITVGVDPLGVPAS